MLTHPTHHTPYTRVSHSAYNAKKGAYHVAKCGMQTCVCATTIVHEPSHGPAEDEQDDGRGGSGAWSSHSLALE